MLPKSFNEESNSNEKAEKKKLAKKPFVFTNPVGNESKFEDRNKVKEYLYEIGSSEEKKSGVPLLYEDSSIYVDAADSHTLIIGATGSKKTRLLVLPLVLLLSRAEESMIVCDPKAEVYRRTAHKLKSEGYKIIVINIRNPSVGDCWNPLDIPFKLFKNGDVDRACEFVNDIATNLMLVDASSKDPYWDFSAADLFFGLTFLTFQIGIDLDSVSIADVLALRRKMFVDEDTMNHKLIDIAKKNDLVYHSLLGTIHNARNTRACILSTFDQKMRCFVYQQNLLDMLSDNTISLDAIGKEKTIIYLIMPDEKATYHKLISLFVKQSYEYLIYKSQDDDNGFSTRINYILDEFSTLPTIKDFPNMITAARSRNIRFNLVIQSLHQLKSRYQDEAETIKSNCSNWIYLTSREIELLKELSELCGCDKNGNSIFSISALQHFDKNLGQALILCGRLFPFISELRDISWYDDEIFEVLKLNKRLNQGDKMQKFDLLLNNLLDVKTPPFHIDSLDDLFES